MKTRSASKHRRINRVLIYTLLIAITALMIVPFLWMLSASIKSKTEVFQMTPFRWIPEIPRWENYREIWTKIPWELLLEIQ